MSGDKEKKKGHESLKICLTLTRILRITEGTSSIYVNCNASVSNARAT